jgi:hypothetical protein
VSDEKAGKRTGIMDLGNQELFTAKDAQPPQQAKPGLAGGPGDAKESKQNQHQKQGPFTTEMA